MKFRKYLERLIKEKRSQMAKLQEESDASQDLNEVRSIGKTLQTLRDEIEEAEKQLKELDEKDKDEDNDKDGEKSEGTEDEAAVDSKEGRARVPANAEVRNAWAAGSYKLNNGKMEKGKDENMEYRSAFMDLVLKNKPIPAELRANQNTTTTDAATVIPTQLVNQIIEKFDNVGMILPLITRTSFAGGVEIPTSTVKPVATWVSEGMGSDRQKKGTGKISFSYYKLRCEISMSMEIGTMALSAFEAKFSENVAKAMTYAIENAIINGTGTGQPSGILHETAPEGQAFTPAGWSFKVITDAEGALPVEYETGAKWCMSKKTFAMIQGITDSNGQPIARMNYGIGKALERNILGRDVVISPYVADGTAFMFDFSDYVLNTIYDMGISKKQDWDTEDLLTKAVMSVDGKVVDKGSLTTVIITAA